MMRAVSLTLRRPSIRQMTQQLQLYTACHLALYCGTVVQWPPAATRALPVERDRPRDREITIHCMQVFVNE